MSIQFSTPVVGSPSPSGVQSVNSGNGINVDNTDPQNPIVNNGGVIQLDVTFNPNGLSPIYMDNSNPNYPYINLFDTPHSTYYTDVAQFAVAPMTPTQVQNLQIWEQANGAIQLVGNSIELRSVGVFFISVSYQVYNADVNGRDVYFAIYRDGSVLIPTIKTITQQGQSYTNYTFTTIIKNNDPNNFPLITFWWATSNSAFVNLELVGSAFSSPAFPFVVTAHLISYL